MTISVPFYENALSFASIMISKNRAYEKTTNLDVVHNAIINPNFNESNWRPIVISEIKKAVAPTPIVSFYEATFKSKIDDSRVCYKCGETHSSHSFKAGFNNDIGVQQYRNSCSECHNEIRKSYAKKPLTESQKIVHKQQMKDWRKTNIDATRKERQQRYWAKHKLMLSDVYILKLLKGKKKTTVKFTAAEIEAKRNAIINKNNISI